MPSLVLKSLVSAAALLQTLSAVVDATSFVPVKRHIPTTGSLRSRDIARRAELLRPRNDIDLHYLPEDGSNAMLITVTASHSRTKYVVVEDFDSLLRDTNCSPHTDTLVLSFRQEDGFEAAKQLWSRDEHLLFVTQHHSCNDKLDRGVYKSHKLSFDDALLRVTATSERVLLGDSPEASSSLIISGSQVDHNKIQRLQRRDDGPEKIDSRVFDLSTAFGSGKDRILSVEGLELYCNDCAVSGQAAAFFKYKINTDIMDCVDRIQKANADGDDILSHIIDGIDAGLGCIGDAAEALFDGLKDDVKGLLDGTPDKELPVIGWVVPEAILGIEATSDIAAKLNFEVSATEGIDIVCSFPGAKGCLKRGLQSLLPSFLQPKFAPPQAASDLAFQVGSWTLGLNFTYGLTVSALAQADVGVSIPITASVGQGQMAQLSIIDPAWQNTFNPDIKVGEPSFSASNPEVCLAVALGPSITAVLASSSFPKLSNVKMSARLDLPKVEACFKSAHNVDHQCNPGTIEDALEMDINADFGLHVELDTIFKKTGNLTPKLYKEFTLDKQCFGTETQGGHTIVNGTGSGNPNHQGSPKPYYPLTNINGTTTASNGTGTLGNGTNPLDPGAGQSNYTSPFDCTGVAPSPGGQPCAYSGGGPVTCLSLYSWSCPNGDSGPVPADTVCACGAFRHPGWQPPTIATPACTEGIHCYDEQTFGVCGPAGIEPPQPVAPGTVCIAGAITYPS